MEYLYMNLLEHHSEQCPSCENLLYGYIPRSFLCWRGPVLVDLVLQCFVVGHNGKIYSVEDELGRPVRVEILRSYWAVHGLLYAIYPRHYRCTYNSLY